jgi:eukaryotic-like serine/threonine-protein kinase
MNQINCLRCKQPFDAQNEQCPQCGERVTLFQRTYSARLLDGKYQIIDRLGVGGMGEIFKVRHIHLNELRVVKIMRPNVAADDQGLQRFLQEARTSTMIKHRNLAMLYDFAQLEDGSYYMVWEFIDGTNIQKWIADNGPVPPRLAVEISAQALMGLDHLHSMGLIHRDISPENIMLSQDHHGKLLVKVIDFGIAKQLAEGEGGQGLTQTGMFLGKLKYASPEQAGFLKEDEHIDPRSDLYSFGIVMYEMLAGRAPFQATNPHGYILKHVTEKPMPILEMNPEVRVPAQLEEIIMRALEKSRDQRYATAAEFANALEAIRGSIPPDQKYGVGERLVTLSGAQTLADLPKFTPGAPMPTMGSTGMQQTRHAPVGGTMGGSNDATVIERGMSPGTMGGNNDATVMDRFDAGSAEPTTLEPKAVMSSGGPAATTAPSPQSPVAQKKTVAMIAAIAALVVLVIAIGAFVLSRKSSVEEPLATATAAPSTAEVSTTATRMAPGQGLLLLSASPWGDLESIINKKDQSEVALNEEVRSTPARIPLDPGAYSVTVSGPGGGQKTVDVQIEAGKATQQNIPLSRVDFDAIARELTKP